MIYIRVFCAVQDKGQLSTGTGGNKRLRQRTFRLTQAKTKKNDNETQKERNLILKETDAKQSRRRRKKSVERAAKNPKFTFETKFIPKESYTI